MNDETYKRYKKLDENIISCLFSIRKDKTFHFLISGSNDKRYRVSIDKKFITCTCPDYKHNCKTMETVCKHCIFILTDTLNVFSLKHDFWKRRFLTPDEYEKIKESYKVNKVKKKKT